MIWPSNDLLWPSITFEIIGPLKRNIHGHNVYILKDKLSAVGKRAFLEFLLKLDVKEKITRKSW